MKIFSIILLIFLPYVLFSQPIQFKKDRLFDDGILEKAAKTFAKAYVKTQSVWMAVEFGKEKKYLYEQNTYDKSGRVIETKDCLPDGKNPWVYKYKYYNDGTIAEKNTEYTIDSITSYDQTNFIYDTKGRLIKSSVIGVKEKTITSAYLYDDENNIISLYTYVNDTEVIAATKYFFNENNWLIKGEAINKDVVTGTTEVKYYKDSLQSIEYENGKLTKIEGITFDKNNNIIQRRYSIPGQKSYIQYKAEYKNGIIAYEKLNHKPEGYYLLEKKYDNKGNLTIENYFEAKNKISQRRIFRYNDNNLLIGIAEGDENIDYDKSQDKTIYEYEYYK